MSSGGGDSCGGGGRRRTSPGGGGASTGGWGAGASTGGCGSLGGGGSCGGGGTGNTRFAIVDGVMNIKPMTGFTSNWIESCVCDAGRFLVTLRVIADTAGLLAIRNVFYFVSFIFDAIRCVEGFFVFKQFRKARFGIYSWKINLQNTTPQAFVRVHDGCRGTHCPNSLTTRTLTKICFPLSGRLSGGWPNTASMIISR